MAEQRYKVIERIDAGGMAEVFKANSTSMKGFEKLVAIKRILPSLTQNERFVRMFLDEAKVSLHLNHTNCVHVFDLGIADGAYFIVMEFVDGTNLKKVIEFLQRKQRPMPVEQAVYIALEICKGLSHAHEKKDQRGNSLDIVHRDISPPNVLISRSGEVKITDFGLAKAKSQAETTDPGVVKGKFGYLSPEAAHGEEVDLRTDIFAIGILLWEMLAGRRLFLGESDYETLQQVRRAKVPSLAKIRADVPRELDDLLRRTLTARPEDRFQSARELGRELASFLFSYGKVVTNYDLAELVMDVVGQSPQRARTAVDAALDAALQQQLNKLKSLEQIEDLDLYLAQHYDSLPDQGVVQENSGDGTFEDPRMWADLGFGGGTMVGADAAPPPMQSLSPDGDADSWQEAGLADIAHTTSAYSAITAAHAPPKAHPKSPPTLPGATRTQATQARPAAPQTPPAPSPVQARPQPESSPGESPAKQSAEKKSLSPAAITILVALIVVALGVAGAFFLGLIPLE